MAMSNRERVERTLAILNRGLVPFVERELKAVHGDRWVGVTVGFVPEHREAGGKVDWDTHALLKVMWNQWNDVFRKTLGQMERSLVSELIGFRNKWAHQEAFSLDDAYRMMDSAERLLRAVSAPEADEVQREKMELQRTRYEEQARRKYQRAAAASVQGQPLKDLPPWREVVTPHPDVTSGRYAQAEFAADLAQVHRGEATPEYQDPREFYHRTFITEGLRRLLIGALQRLAGEAVDPIIQLQTNFGGGKTHALIALYHLASGTDLTALPGLDEVLQEAGVKPPQGIKPAVIVGSALSPANTVTKDDGTVVHTLWGEMAWQLLGPEGYAYVREADEHGVNPGSDALRQLLSAAAPCLILIDEWIVYVRDLLGKDDMPGGTFDAAFGFAQSLTEAVRAVPKALLVASIPASDNEIGGEAGKIALERLRNVFGRMDSPWRPASAEEGFEIVRRRLFQPITDPEKHKARDVVARAFGEYYRQHSTEFPAECRELDYERRVRDAYPIHPELFARLYSDWSTLDKFQRTRGVLRLMAKVIQILWERNDGSLLILPASIPIDDPVVKSELTNYLDDNWVPIIDSDVDGPHSLPLRLDNRNPTLGRYSACRRVARTIYLGSAPTVGTANRGIDDRHVKLGCTQPGESVATFGDALRRLLDRASYLFSDQGRYWYDTHQNVTKTARDRAAQLSQETVREEIKRLLRAEQRSRGDFIKVYPAPVASGDVPDETETRLVILAPEYPYVRGADLSPALEEANEILGNRGTSPRSYRNTLVFLAADQERLNDLETAVRSQLAWRSIVEDWETLGLNAYQKRQAEDRAEGEQRTVNQQLPEVFRWLLVPVQKRGEEVKWQAIRVQGDGSLAVRASKRLKKDGLLYTNFAPTELRMELDRVPLWRGDHVPITQLMEDFARYLYLPRLRSPELIVHAIEQGIRMLSWEQDSFAYAEGYDEKEKRYRGLIAGRMHSIIVNPQALVVKPDVAARQLEQELEVPAAAEKSGKPTETGSDGERPTGTTGKPQAPTKPETKLCRFYGSVALDPLRIGTQAGQIGEEVIQHLAALPSAEVEVTLEIQIKVPDGIPDDKVRIVTENCTTLGFDSQEFEKE